ncbi:hypothetical protein KCP75_19880 [Salmonella enterica subsp. enterica]|nr:hypothetical protein KCP75_19880 [Salmonella enterica subsp. enterica]
MQFKHFTFNGGDASSKVRHQWQRWHGLRNAEGGSRRSCTQVCRPILRQFTVLRRADACQGIDEQRLTSGLGHDTAARIVALPPASASASISPFAD